MIRLGGEAARSLANILPRTIFVRVMDPSQRFRGSQKKNWFETREAREHHGCNWGRRGKLFGGGGGVALRPDEIPQGAARSLGSPFAVDATGPVDASRCLLPFIRGYWGAVAMLTDCDASL